MAYHRLWKLNTGWVLGVLGVLGILAVALAICALWVPRLLLLPKGVLGPFTVGTAVLQFAPAQMARWSDGDPEHPIPLVTLWYPVSPVTAASQPKSMLQLRFFGRRLLDDAVKNARPAPGPGQLPVILYFSGWPGTRLDNRTAVYNLASHGFVVATVVYGAHLPGISDAAYERQRQALQRPMDFSTGSSATATIQLADSRARTRALDATTILDAITLLNTGDSSDRFLNRLDLGKIGIFGYSFGGAIAAQAGLVDPRIKAVANLDGWHFAEAATDGVPKPYLLVSDSTPLPTAAELGSSDPGTRALATLNEQDYRRARHNLQLHGGYFLTISGTTHGSFTDAPFYSDFHWPWKASDSTSRVRAMSIVNTFLLSFFERELLGRNEDFFNPRHSSYPEAHLEAWNADHPTPPGQ